MADTKNNVPALRFPEFSGEWEEKKFGEFAPLQRGFDLPINTITDGRYPVVFSNGVLKKHNEYKVIGPGVITGRSGTIGKVIYVEGNFWPHNTALWVTDFSDNDPKYVFFYIEKFDFSRFSTGSGVPTLNRNDIHSQTIFVPRKNEQKKIAGFLSVMDVRIDLLKKKKEQIEEYKRGVLQQIFSGRFRFKNSTGNNYPNWGEKKIGNLITQSSIRNKNGSIKIVLSVNNRKGFVRQLDQFDGYSVASENTSNYKIVKRDYFAYNPSRINVGSIARLKNEEIGIVSPMYIVFKAKNELNVVFFENYLQTHRLKHFIKVSCSGSVRDSLNFDALADFDILLPSLEEQQKIADFLSAIDKKIELCEKQIADTEKFKKGLLQQMFV